MKVVNMIGRTGKPVANQFIITDGDGYSDYTRVFQSYNSVIVKITAENGLPAITELDRNKWDYSTTTGRYRNQFLGETKKETQAKIDSGKYLLVDLN